MTFYPTIHSLVVREATKPASSPDLYRSTNPLGTSIPRLHSPSCKPFLTTLVLFPQTSLTSSPKYPLTHYHSFAPHISATSTIVSTYIWPHDFTKSASSPLLPTELRQTSRGCYILMRTRVPERGRGILGHEQPHCEQLDAHRSDTDYPYFLSNESRGSGPDNIQTATYR